MWPAKPELLTLYRSLLMPAIGMNVWEGVCVRERQGERMERGDPAQRSKAGRHCWPGAAVPQGTRLLLTSHLSLQVQTHSTGPMYLCQEYKLNVQTLMLGLFPESCPHLSMLTNNRPTYPLAAVAIKVFIPEIASSLVSLSA